VIRAIAAFFLIALAACGPETGGAPPAPVTLTAEAAGHFCQMSVLDHPGPKAQVHLAGYDHPLWFTQVRDAVAFLRQPEQVAEITAIYVSDMSAAPSWDNPGTDNWIDITAASLVVGGDRRGGMGAPELVPFARAEDARAFAAAHGGEVLTLGDVTDETVLGPVPVEPGIPMPEPGGDGGPG